MKGVPLPLGRPSICRRGLRWAGLRLRGPCPRVVWAFPLPPPRCLSWGCRRSLSVRPCPTTVGPKRTTSWPFSTQSSSFTRGSFETATPYRKCRWTQPTPRVESSTATPRTEQPSNPSSLQRVIYGDDCQSLSRSLRYSKIDEGHRLLHVLEGMGGRHFCLAMDFRIFGYHGTFQLGVPAISPISAISAS